MHPLLKKFQGGDRRSIGKSPEVVDELLVDPKLFNVVFDGMLSENPVIRMRCADAAEKITSLRPDLLQPQKRKLLREVARIPQQEVRWPRFRYLNEYPIGKEIIFSNGLTNRVSNQIFSRSIEVV